MVNIKLVKAEEIALALVFVLALIGGIVLMLVGSQTLDNPTPSETNTKNTEKLIGIILLSVAGGALVALLFVLYVNRGKKEALPPPPASAYAMRYGPYQPAPPQYQSSGAQYQSYAQPQYPSPQPPPYQPPAAQYLLSR